MAVLVAQITIFARILSKFSIFIYLSATDKNLKSNQFLLHISKCFWTSRSLSYPSYVEESKNKFLLLWLRTTNNIDVSAIIQRIPIYWLAYTHLNDSFHYKIVDGCKKWIVIFIIQKKLIRMRIFYIHWKLWIKTYIPSWLTYLFIMLVSVLDIKLRYNC